MVSVWGMTDKGIVRRENQDSCAYDIIEEGKLTWGVVCDGMGGAKAGDVASKMAVEAFCTQMDQLGDLEGPPPAEALLRTATEDANRVVYLKAQTDADCIGMGTTLVGLILQEATLWVVNVGDSRAYRITKGGIRRITRDHSVVEDLVARGDLTPEQARSHPQKNLITRALGTSSRVKADLFQETVSPGDAILLCSDGLVNQVTDQEICQEIQAGGTAQEICQRLVTRTLDSGAPDNVTVVLFQL